LKYSGEGETVPCPYCNNSVIVPQELRPRTPEAALPAAQSVPRLTPMQLDVIKDFLRQGKKIEAIKVYRQATLVNLKDAKALVEAIQADDPQLKDRPQSARPAKSEIGGKITGLLVGLAFLGIAAIFPIVFYPLGMDALHIHQYAAAFFSFLGAFIWAVIWGLIGVVIL